MAWYPCPSCCVECCVDDADCHDGAFPGSVDVTLPGTFSNSDCDNCDALDNATFTLSNNTAVSTNCSTRSASDSVYVYKDGEFCTNGDGDDIELVIFAELLCKNDDGRCELWLYVEIDNVTDAYCEQHKWKKDITDCITDLAVDSHTLTDQLGTFLNNCLIGFPAGNATIAPT